MCVRVRFSSCAELSPFDAAAQTIVLPRSLAPAHAVTVVRAILVELAVEQPDLGARCWCGEPVDLLPRVPQQRRSDQVIKHGA